MAKQTMAFHSRIDGEKGMIVGHKIMCSVGEESKGTVIQFLFKESE